MCCGSNSHTVLPASSRSAAVAAHRSPLLEVAMTAPGADRTYGMDSAVVLPERGAMNATTVSSHDAYSSALRLCGCCLSSPSSSPTWDGPSVDGSVPVRARRSVTDLAAAWAG